MQVQDYESAMQTGSQPVDVAILDVASDFVGVYKAPATMVDAMLFREWAELPVSVRLPLGKPSHDILIRLTESCPKEILGKILGQP